MKKKDRFNIAVALTCVMQAGLSVVIPPLAFTCIAKFLVNKFELPEKIVLFALVFGVLSGFYNMIKYIYALLNRKG